jgi:phage baseplate assembly protein V
MIAALARRLQALTGAGTVKATSSAGPALLAQVTMGPQEMRDDVPVLGLAGVVSHPLPGSDCMVLFPGGNRGNAVVIAHGNKQYQRRSTRPGDLGFAHHGGWSVMLTPDGITVDGGGKPVTVRNASKCRMECDLEVTGEITARCDGAAVHLSTHTHPVTGSTTGKPQG